MAGPIKFEHHVDAAPDRVFAVFSDLEHVAERISGISALEVLTSGPIGKGTRFKETRVLFGKDCTEEMQITTFEPGRSYTTEAFSNGNHYRTIMDFLPDGKGTRVVMSMHVTPKTFGAKLMAPLMGLMAKSMMKKCLGKDFAELGAVAESRPAN